jgi:hypothetical protein
MRLNFLLKTALFSALIIFTLKSKPVFAANQSQELESFDSSFFFDIKREVLALPSPQNNMVKSDELLYFLKSVELYQKLNQYVEGLGHHLKDMVKRGDVLTGYELSLLSKSLGAYHYLSVIIQKFASLNPPKQLDKKVENSFEQKDMQKGQQRLIWLAANLLILDGNIKIHHTYFKNGKLRRILKDIFDTNFTKLPKLGELQRIFYHTGSKDNQKALSTQVITFRRQRDRLRGPLKNLINKLDVTKLLADRDTYSFAKYSFVDGFYRGVETFTNVLSGLFGNFAGSIRWRQGFLHKRPEVIQMLKEKLRPLDIILEKTPFALTDKFIPGNFGHAAIWLGTKAQLQEIGMWDHPVMLPYQNQIEKGYYILEAIRPGTGLKTLEDFLEIDQILIMRQKEILKDKAEVEAIFARGMSQIGKKYDFNFNVHTSDAIVCSELIYHSFGKVNWPTKYILGRATISPDNLAELLLYNKSPVEIDIFYHADNRRELKKWSIDTLSSKLDFVPNPDGEGYVKPYKKCRTTLHSRGFKRSTGRRMKKVCKTGYKKYTYSVKTPYPVLDLEFNK